MTDTPDKQLETRPAVDFAAHLSSQLLGCTAELQSLARILADGRPLSEPLAQNMVSSLCRVVGQLRRLGHDTLALSRAAGPDQLFSLVPLEPVTLVEEVVDGFRRRGAEGRLQIRDQMAGSRLCWGQPERLKMVLESLIGPLLQAEASPPRCLTITLEEYHGYLERENGHLLVSISNPDTAQPAGCGWPFINSTPDESAERFNDGSNLSVSRQLIALHGGQLEAEAANGDGLLFWFTLPLVEHTEERCNRC